MNVSILAVVVLAGLLAIGPARVVSFPGGRVVIEQHGAAQHVIIEGRRGETEAISDCDADTGTYDEVARLARSFKDAVRRNERDAVATMMMYPLRVNAAPGTGYFVATKESLLARYGKVFTPTEIRRIERVEPHAVFCRNGMSTVGSGAFWAQVSRGVLRIAVMNTGR